MPVPVPVPVHVPAFVESRCFLSLFSSDALLPRCYGMLCLQVILGGGPPAVDVAKQDAGPGKFDSRFFHMVSQDEFGRVGGHFGPIQTIAINPDGRRCVCAHPLLAGCIQ